MATVSEDLALKEVVRLGKQKRPKMYCVVKYFNTFNGSDGYALCRGRVQLEAVRSSPACADVEFLWQSKRCQKDEKDRASGTGVEDTGVTVAKQLGFL